MRRFAKQAVVLRDEARRRPVSEFRRFKRKLGLIMLAICALVAAAALTLWWRWEYPLVSPVNQLTSFQFIRHPIFQSQSDKIVYGFLPYWNISQLTLHPQLTHLAYFGLTINSQGKLVTTNEGEIDAGYSRLQSDSFLEVVNNATNNQAQVELVIKQFYADDISAFLLSEKARATFLQELESVLLAYDFSGINIDIELNGTASPELRDAYTVFLREVRQFLDARFGEMNLSIDVYASAANDGQIWDLQALEPLVDYVVVMAYDFHRSSSSQAGPVAPLFGGKKFWDSDINSHLKQILKLIPSHKILLGIPFYGYEWQTTSTAAQSHTFPDTGQAVVYGRIEELLDGSAGYKVTEHWNEDALAPYLTYHDGDETYVLYYDNQRSISYKLDYVNQLDLAGIAIWALGYEGESEELWQAISEKI